MREPNASAGDSPISSRDEGHERDLNRHRRDDQRRAVAEAVVRLRSRAIDVGEDERAEDVVRLLEAVEAFERAVQARGGDLMVNTPPSSRPENPNFVLPRRRDDETMRDFIERVRRATDRLNTWSSWA
jgi:hypothetical protein